MNLRVRDLDLPPGMDLEVWGRVLTLMGDEVIARFRLGEEITGLDVDREVMRRLADELGLYVPELDDPQPWVRDPRLVAPVSDRIPRREFTACRG